MPSTSGDASDLLATKHDSEMGEFQCPQHRAMHLTERNANQNPDAQFQCPQHRAMHLTNNKTARSQRATGFNALNIGRCI